MGALKNVIQLVATKKLALSEEEMAAIIFKVAMGLDRSWMDCTISMTWGIPYIAILSRKTSCWTPRERSRSLTLASANASSTPLEDPSLELWLTCMVVVISGVLRGCRSARRRATPTNAIFGASGWSSSSWQRADPFPIPKWTNSTTFASARRSSTTSLLSCQPACFPLKWATSSSDGTPTNMQPH